MHIFLPLVTGALGILGIVSGWKDKPMKILVVMISLVVIATALTIWNGMSDRAAKKEVSQDAKETKANVALILQLVRDSSMNSDEKAKTIEAVRKAFSVCLHDSVSVNESVDLQVIRGGTVIQEGSQSPQSPKRAP